MGYTETGRPQWSTTAVGKKNVVLAAILLTLFCVFFTFRNQSPPSSGTVSSSRTSTSTFSLGGKKDNLGDIYNDTLGVRIPRSLHSIDGLLAQSPVSLGLDTDAVAQFQKVYAINLPERTDKKDNMRLQAKATNFSIEIVDGVIGSKVSYKAIPYVSTREGPGRVVVTVVVDPSSPCQTFKQNNGTIGCWRAHLNVLQK